LLVSAGVLGRTLLRLSSMDPGVDVRNVLVARMALSPALLSSPASARAGWEDVLARARHAPGVVAAATVDTVPLRGGLNRLVYGTNAALPPPADQPGALAMSVPPDYLTVMGIPLKRGRFFTDRDRLTTERVIAVDDVLAAHAFRGDDAVGRQLWVPDLGSGPFTIVGVVKHVRYWGVASDDQASLRAQVYYPFAQ